MGSRSRTCDYGHQHSIEYCDRCQKEFINITDRFEIMIRRGQACLLTLFCRNCVLNDMTLRTMFGNMTSFSDLYESHEKCPKWP